MLIRVNTKARDTYMCNTVTPHPFTVSLKLVKRRGQGISGLNNRICPLFRYSHAGHEVRNLDLLGLNLGLSKARNSLHEISKHSQKAEEK